MAMFGQVLGVYQNIIDVNQDEFVEVLPEHLIHEFLEHRGCVYQAIRHDPIFIVAFRANKGSLPFILTLDPNEVECTMEIQLDKDGRSSQ